MKISLTAALVGASLAAHLASAGDSLAETGRYQLIPKVAIPNQSGKTREQPVLLDTETGQTWRLGKESKGKKADGLQWVPLDIELPERPDSEAASIASAKVNKKRRGSESTRKYFSPNIRLDEYDDDP